MGYENVMTSLDLDESALSSLANPGSMPVYVLAIRQV